MALVRCAQVAMWRWVRAFNPTLIFVVVTTNNPGRYQVRNYASHDLQLNLRTPICERFRPRVVNHQNRAAPCYPQLTLLYGITYIVSCKYAHLLPLHKDTTAPPSHARLGFS